MECRKYNEQRKTLRKEVGPGRMRTEKLLGYPKLIKHTMQYVIAIMSKKNNRKHGKDKVHETQGTM